jgi:hypothetical protein
VNVGATLEANIRKACEHRAEPNEGFLLQTLGQKYCYMSRLSTRRAKESVLPLQGLLSHLGASEREMCSSWCMSSRRTQFPSYLATNLRLERIRTFARKCGAVHPYH